MNPAPQYDPTLWAEALAYLEAHGDHWPDEAVAHLRVLSQTADRATFEHWISLIDLLTEIAESPRH